MNQTGELEPAPGPRKRGLSPSTSALVAGLLGLLIVGAAMLKMNHLRKTAHRIQWQDATFEVPRPAFDRVAFEADAGDTLLGRAPGATAVAAFREGMSAYLLGDDRRALVGFLRAVRQEPHWPTARFYLGAIRLLEGHPLAAVADLRQAQEMGFAPPDGPCAWWLGLAQLYGGDRESGQRQLENVVAMGGEHSAEALRILQRLAASSDTPIPEP